MIGHMCAFQGSLTHRNLRIGTKYIYIYIIYTVFFHRFPKKYDRNTPAKRTQKPSKSTQKPAKVHKSRFWYGWKIRVCVADELFEGLPSIIESLHWIWEKAGFADMTEVFDIGFCRNGCLQPLLQQLKHLNALGLEATCVLARPSKRGLL